MRRHVSIRPAIIHVHVQIAGNPRPEKTALLPLDSALPGAGDRLHPQLGVFTSIRNERKLLPVWRPPHVSRVPVAVGNGESIATVYRHQPQLVPLPPKI